jgi:nitrite reductase/ring-hydroxylating ferredoxin subunit
MSDENWRVICRDADLEDGGMLPIEIGDFQIAVYRVGGEFFATDNVCTHGFALLTDGILDDDVVECPLHGGMFNIKSGKALCDPVDCDVRTYRTRQVDDRVEILLEPSSVVQG